jgi:hypothetical protein
MDDIVSTELDREANRGQMENLRDGQNLLIIIGFKYLPYQIRQKSFRNIFTIRCNSSVE